MKVERSSIDQVRERFSKNKRKIEEKKDTPEYDLDAQLKNMEKQDEERKLQKKMRKKKHHEEEGEPAESFDDEMAKMMGFSGFGGSKKNH
jgi:U4/U6.U5 tri-snRNP component SNU23